MESDPAYLARSKALADRDCALSAIMGQARAALECNRFILELIRRHDLKLIAPPDRPLLELLTAVIVLKDRDPAPRTNPPDGAGPED